MRKHNHHYYKTDVAYLRGYSSIDDAYKDLYLRGYSMSQIAKLFSVTRKAIEYRLKKMGVKSRPRGGNNRRKT